MPIFNMIIDILLNIQNIIDYHTILFHHMIVTEF